MHNAGCYFHPYMGYIGRRGITPGFERVAINLARDSNVLFKSGEIPASVPWPGFSDRRVAMATLQGPKANAALYALIVMLLLSKR